MAQRLACWAEDREVPGSSPHPRLTFQSCSRYQLNQLGSKAASELTFKKSNTCGVSNNRLYFFFYYAQFFKLCFELHLCLQIVCSFFCVNVINTYFYILYEYNWRLIYEYHTCYTNLIHVYIWNTAYWLSIQFSYTAGWAQPSKENQQISAKQTLSFPWWR